MNNLKTCPKCLESEFDKNGRCIPCKKAYLAAWRIQNHDKVKADRLRWWRDNRERAEAKRKLWLADNAERVSEYMRKWSAENPEKRRANEATRRQRMGSDQLPDNIRADLLALQDGVCPLCNAPLIELSELDHRVPLAKGGKNVAENVQLVHPLCNRKKGVKLPRPNPQPAAPAPQ